MLMDGNKADLPKVDNPFKPLDERLDL